MAWARRLFWRAAALRCMMPLEAMRSIVAWDFTSAAAAAFLSPPAMAFLTSLIALRAAVRMLMLWARSLTAWRARLRADLMLAMCLFQLPKGREF